VSKGVDEDGMDVDLYLDAFGCRAFYEPDNFPMRMYGHFEVAEDGLLSLQGQTTFQVYGASGGLTFILVRYRLKIGPRGFRPYPEICVADGPWQETDKFEFNASEAEIAELERRFASSPSTQSRPALTNGDREKPSQSDPGQPDRS
jgi:hypothetical protein